MIAIDTSAIVAIARREREAESFNRALAVGKVLIGAPTLVEASIVLPASLSDEPAMVFLDKFVSGHGVEIVAFSREMFEAARKAFLRYGKGRGHPAQLNFGDCMTYATAKVLDAPLLFKGADFSKTDIRPALR